MDFSSLAQEIGFTLEQYLSLVRSFVKQTKADIRTLDEAAGRNDLESVRQAAHHIKGAAANLELSEMADVCLKLEQTAKAGKGENVQALLQLLKDTFKTFEDAVVAEEAG